MGYFVTRVPQYDLYTAGYYMTGVIALLSLCYALNIVSTPEFSQPTTKFFVYIGLICNLVMHFSGVVFGIVIARMHVTEDIPSAGSQEC